MLDLSQPVEVKGFTTFDSPPSQISRDGIYELSDGRGSKKRQIGQLKIVDPTLISLSVGSCIGAGTSGVGAYEASMMVRGKVKVLCLKRYNNHQHALKSAFYWKILREIGLPTHPTFRINADRRQSEVLTTYWRGRNGLLVDTSPTNESIDKEHLTHSKVALSDTSHIFSQAESILKKLQNSDLRISSDAYFFNLTPEQKVRIIIGDLEGLKLDSNNSHFQKNSDHLYRAIKDFLHCFTSTFSSPDTRCTTSG